MTRFANKVLASIAATALISTASLTIPEATARQSNSNPIVTGSNSAPVDSNSDNNFSPDEVMTAGHRFFGNVSGDMALAVQSLFSKYGEPNGYILGEEGGGAFIAGLRYGEGTLYTRNSGQHKIYWQGPSIGFDIGVDGSRTMMLVYNMNEVEEMYRPFVGVNGSAYMIGGVGVTVLSNHNVLAAPIRAGVGARLGVSAGYLKFTHSPTWNPF